MSIKQAIPYLKQTYTSWSDHNAPRLGASVAFYSILSFAPLLLLITAIIGLVFGNESAHGALVNEAKQVIGQHGAETVDSLLKNAQKPASGTFASIIAFITLLFGASGVFTELQDALNIMWDATKQQASGFMGMIKQKLFSFGMVLSVGFLLLVSLLLSSALAFVGKAFGQVVSLPAPVLELLNFVVSLVVITALFALMFKYVPDAKVAWRDVIVGAIGTALLFTIGKFVLGIYLGKASPGSTYGAAGSLVAVVVWIYYSAQIFFFGAEFTHVYAVAHHGQENLLPVANAPAQAESPAVAEQRPKAMAAAAAASASDGPSTIKLTGAPLPQPAPPIKAVQEIPVRVEPVVKTITFHHAPLQRPTKPRLLGALALGFFLGRVVLKLGNQPSRDTAA